jgi:hypothetical protein
MMRRTKEWWKALAPEERSHLVYIEKHRNGLAGGSAYLPEGVGECPACGQLSRLGLCDYCANAREKYIAKADKALESEQ